MELGQRAEALAAGIEVAVRNMKNCEGVPPPARWNGLDLRIEQLNKIAVGIGELDIIDLLTALAMSMRTSVGPITPAKLTADHWRAIVVDAVPLLAPLLVHAARLYREGQQRIAEADLDDEEEWPEGMREIAEYIVAHNGCSQADAYGALHISPATFNRHWVRLRDAHGFHTNRKTGRGLHAPQGFECPADAC